jgi:hypothetical protein
MGSHAIFPISASQAAWITAMSLHWLHCLNKVSVFNITWYLKQRNNFKPLFFILSHRTCQNILYFISTWLKLNSTFHTFGFWVTLIMEFPILPFLYENKDIDNGYVQLLQLKK